MWSACPGHSWFFWVLMVSSMPSFSVCAFIFCVTFGLLSMCITLYLFTLHFICHLTPQSVHLVVCYWWTLSLLQNQCFGLERTFRGHLAHPPLQWAGTSSTRPGCSERRPTLNVSRDGASTSSLGNLFQCFHHPHHKKILPYMQSKSTLPHCSLSYRNKPCWKYFPHLSHRPPSGTERLL